MIKSIVDGGYLSWVYGCRDGTQTEWESAASWYSFMNGSLILLDHILSYRQELDHTYKSKRANRRAIDPMKAATREKVHKFTLEKLVADHRLATFSWSGLEADDLVALMVTRGQTRPIPIVGVDKDLLQLPFTSIRMRKINDEQVHIGNYVRRLPRALQPYVRRGRDVLLCLALMGDKSDTVERIAPLRDFRQMIELLHHPRPFRQAARWFGDFEVGRNVYLTVLPGPWVYETLLKPIEVMDQLDDGTWWTDQSKPLQPKLAAALEGITEGFRNAKTVHR